MCKVIFCVVEKGYFLWPVHSLGRLQLAFAQLHFVLQSQICLLLCISCREGNGNPLQYSCLENPMDGAWWAAIYGVAQSRTRLKGLSSNSSIASCNIDQVETCAVYPTSLGTSLVLNCTGSCLVCQPSVGCILRRSIVSWWQQSGISSSRLFRLLG